MRARSIAFVSLVSKSHATTTTENTLKALFPEHND
jgi:Flp pilus assembly CpaE family ATPase